MGKFYGQFFIPRNIRFWLIRFAIVLFAVGNSVESRASHAMGADLTYTWVSGNTYHLKFSFYRFCDGIFPPSIFTVDVTSSCFAGFSVNLPCTNFSSPTEISPVCNTAASTCSGGTFIGVQEYIYEGNVTLPGPCADWRFSTSECCRNSTITTTVGGAGDDLYVYSLLNNTNGQHNNSCQFANYPVPFACRGQRFCFNHGASEVDGDSVVYQMITPLTTLGAVTYLPGYSASQPISSSPAVRFNTITGDICMDPTALEVSVFAVLVSEYRNGVLIGQVERDIQLNILQCSNRLPSLTGINGSPTTTKTVCVGEPINFYIASIDPDQTNSTYITWDYSIPGATFNVHGGNNAFGGHRDTANFSWTPTMADVGSNQCFTVFVTDDNCPIIGTSVVTYCINVRTVDVTAGPDLTVACGQCTQLSATGIGGTGNYTFTWNPGLPDSVVSQVLNPACVGTYIVRVRDSSCTNYDTVNVVPGANNISAGFNSVSNCSGAPVVFTDQSSGGAVSSWSWNFGDGGTSNVQNPTHQYAANGTYDVTLIVATLGGCTDTVLQQVTVNTNIPVALFTAPPVCQGATTSFTDASTGGPISTYAWDFGDPGSGGSNTSSASNPTHTYSTSGTFTATLIVNNLAGCADTLQQSVVINSLPSINVPNQQMCFGQQVTLTAPPGFSSYSWNNGATSQSITVSPASTIGYDVVVTDANGCTATDGAQVVVDQLPIPSAGNNQTICDGVSTSLTGTGASTYSWNPGNLSGGTITVSPSITTTYTVTATSTAGCTATATVTINVNAMPQVSADNNTAVCKGETVTINATSTTANFIWQPGNISGPSITVTPLSTTTYTVTVSDAIGCSGTDQVTIQVNPLPVAQFTSTAPQCEGFSVAFSDISSVSSGTVNGWNWDFSNGQTASAQNPNIVYQNDGSYSIQLIVTTDQGCKDTVSNSILINPTPVANAGLDQQICPGFPATLTGSGGASYQWSPGGSTTASITVSPISTTQYDLTVTDANGCQDTANVRVIVNPVPVADAGINQSICFGTSTTLFASGGTDYLWLPGNVQSANYNITPGATSTYTVIVANTFGCLDTDDVVVRVNPLPVASFSQTSPVCNSIPVSFTDASNVASGSVTSWNWDLGNSTTSVVQSPVLQYTSPGTYQVQLIITTDEGCKDTTAQTVTINAEPVAAFTSIDVCDGLPVLFSDLSSISDATPLSYSWNLGDNATANTQAVSHQYAGYGSYPVTLIVNSIHNCPDTVTRFANVFALPQAQFVTQFACEDNGAAITDQSTIPQGGIATWNWSFGDGSFGTDVNPIHTYPDPGYYQIDLLVTSDQGCQDTATGAVRSVPAPLADFSTQDVCYGFQTPLTDLSTPVTGSIVSYLWEFGDGQTSTDQSPFHIYPSPGWFQVALTITSDSGCVTRIVRPNAVNIFPPPVAQFADNATEASDLYPIVSFTNLTGTLGTYFWSFGDGDTSALYSPTHTYDTVGVYEIVLIAIDLNGCVDTLRQGIDIRPTSNVYIPSSFTPNGDSKNDIFRAYTYNVLSVVGDIYDRWGLPIYHWDGLNAGWDGLKDGNAVQNDVYVYRIVTTDVNSKRQEHIGRVTVVR